MFGRVMNEDSSRHLIWLTVMEQMTTGLRREEWLQKLVHFLALVLLMSEQVKRLVHSGAGK